MVSKPHLGSLKAVEIGDALGLVSKVPVFSGQNYAAWKVKMKAYLRAYDLWDAVEKEDEADSLPEHPTAAQKKELQ